MTAVTLRVGAGSPEMRVKQWFGAALVAPSRLRPGIWMLAGRPMSFPEVVQRANEAMAEKGMEPIRYVAVGADPVRCRVPGCRCGAEVVPVLMHPQSGLKHRLKLPVCRPHGGRMSAAQVIGAVAQFYARRAAPVPPLVEFRLTLEEV